MPSSSRAFVVMPFGVKKAPDGTEIDFDAVYADLYVPAIRAAGLQPHRADADRRGGSILSDMFQELLLAEFVVADVTLDNPNVWYELGVRHALRSQGTLLTFALRDRLPFDIAGQRGRHYTLAGGKLHPEKAQAEREAITGDIKATANAWRGRRVSPVYDQLPNLKEPDWRSLRVGSVNEFWQGLEAWEQRLKAARGKQRPGDILVLAEETPNQVLHFEALRAAAKELVSMKHPRYALTILEQARKIDPDDVVCRQQEGIALGREQRFEDAKILLRKLAAERANDGETLGLLARTVKDEWTRLWKLRKEELGGDPVAAARDTAPALQRAAAAYLDAFRAAPAEVFPGINALTLGRLWEHVTGERAPHDLEVVAHGVRWAVECTLGKDKRDYWAMVSGAELALVEGRAGEAVRGYRDAATLAVSERNRFALDSSRQQLDFLGALRMRPEIVREAAAIIEQAEKQLDGLAMSRAATPPPSRVVLFSGHMVDNPAVRGPGKKAPRFPAEKVESAARRIRQALDEAEAKAGDLGICGGACGGDLLFAEACLERGMRLEVRLAQREAEFLRESVTFADPRRAWQKRFTQVTSNSATQVLVMPDELGPAPEGVSVHDRCNRWMLYSALSHGLRQVAFIALWDGAPGDGPGGTEQMVELVRRLTGHQPTVIDPATLA